MSRSAGCANRGAALVFLGFFALAPSPAHSADGASLSIGLGGGAYRPKPYTSNSILKDHFGTGGTTLGRLECGWVIHRLVSLEGSIGYFQATKTYTQPTIDPNIIASGEYTIIVLPVDVSLIFRADFFRDQVLIPYIGLGGDEVYFVQQGKTSLWGWKWGSHALGGLRIFLNPLDRRHTGNLRTDYGIKGVYLDLQAKYAVVYRHNNGDTSGFDLSGWFFTGSFVFEF